MAMMGIKQGTKMWGDTRSEPLATKSDGKENLNSQELAQLGGDNVGDVLNKIADPNWIDPSKKMRAVGSDKLDKDAFMKLMLAQMKNQDPTNPLKSHEMAAQLAQFSSLEQLQNVNTSLDAIKTGQKPTETYQALNFIGKAVSGDSSKVLRMKGDKDHAFNFVLPAAAKSADILVKNDQGETVRKVQLKDLKQGENSWRWNGEGENGLPAQTGEYKFVIEAKDATGKKVAVRTSFDGTITGVNYTADGPVLLVGDQAVKLKDVKKIVDPSVNANHSRGETSVNPQKDQNSQIQPQAELKMTAEAIDNRNMPAGEQQKQALNFAAVAKAKYEAESAAKQGVTKTSGAVEKETAKAGNLEGMRMAPELMDKVKKESSIR